MIHEKAVCTAAGRCSGIFLFACTAGGKTETPAESTDASAATPAEETKTDAPAETTGETGEIGGKLVIWEHNSSFEDALKAVIEGFNEKYPNVEVEYSVKTSDQYYNLLQTAMQANECPDLFWTNGKATTNYQAYVDQGLMMDLTDKVDFSLYDSTSAMKLVTADDGRVYSTPTAETGGRAVFYNKDIFDENGWTIPTTFSEFEELLAKVAQTDYVPIALGATDPWDILFIWEPILAATHLDWIQEYETEGYAAVNDPRVADAYNKMIEWGDKGYFRRQLDRRHWPGGKPCILHRQRCHVHRRYVEHLHLPGKQPRFELRRIPDSVRGWADSVCLHQLLRSRCFQQDRERSGSDCVRKLFCEPGGTGKMARHAGLYLLRCVHRFRQPRRQRCAELLHSSGYQLL